jgi:hypothetical protein
MFFVFHSEQKHVVIKPKDHAENEVYLLAWEIDMGRRSAMRPVKRWGPAIYYLP